MFGALLPQFLCWNPGRALERYLGHGGGAFTNEISALIKETRVFSCPFGQVRTQQEDGHLGTRKGLPSDSKSASAST